MFGPKFGEKCIIMHFLVVEKEGKGLNAEAQRKDWRKIRYEKTIRRIAPVGKNNT